MKQFLGGLMATALFVIPQISFSIENDRPEAEPFYFYKIHENAETLSLDIYTNPRGNIVNAVEIHVSYLSTNLTFKSEEGGTTSSYALPTILDDETIVVSSVDVEAFWETRKIRTITFKKKAGEVFTPNFTILSSSLLLLADGEGTNIFKQ
jgi:hypothetical protein